MAIVVGYVPVPEGQAALDRAHRGGHPARQPPRRPQREPRRRPRRPALRLEPADWDAVKAQLDESGVEHEVAQAIEARDPADQLLRVAEETNAELIVIGLRRRTPVGKLIMGSAAQTVLLEAERPVLAVKAATH